MLSNGRTLESIVSDCLYEMGDASAAIWNRTSLYRYARLGYLDLAVRAELIWGVDYVPDVPYAGNYTQRWEVDLDNDPRLPGGWNLYSRFNSTSPAEVEFDDNLTPPATITAQWEYQYASDASLTGVGTMSAVLPLPVDARKVARVSNDRRPISPVRRSELQAADSRFHLTQGPVIAYSLDTDGISSIRKYRVPTSVATLYPQGNASEIFGVLRGSMSPDATAVTTVASSGMRIDEFASTADGSIGAADRARFSLLGFSPGSGPAASTTVSGQAITELAEFTGMTVIGRYGILRRAPGLSVPAHTRGTSGGLGGVRRLHHYNNNTRVEYYGIGDSPTDPPGSIRFELPRVFVKLLKHWIKWHAWDMEGPGHSDKLADLSKARYDAGVARAIKRKTVTRRTITAGSMAGGNRGNGRPPRPSLPWNYGRVARFPY